ncbi:myxosortase MrtZ [Nannocystis punicea]|uniref:MrtZ family glutamic-type intramembrane protease n=1 Tax=Nannocystis punicea TaxID=2995304 RepID=A0ABY7H330_9BACT|nr:MrtZ family glutamic-type intramembrane protease [Nannocystis poenicansa]WAS93607.1 MrtZ family glutamic-type intramembrane protease [Nannocystis poenicansa]
MTSPEASRRARTAVLATCGLYAAYGLMGLVPGLSWIRGAALVAAFYFLPGWLLRDEPEVQARYQVGPEGPIPPWSWRGLRWAAGACLLVFPPFVLGFWWFYDEVCAGDLRVLTPALWLEQLTPWAGGLELYLERLCRGHSGGFWPESLRLPATWTAYGGLGFVFQVVEGLFAVALAEEVFHRGYLMSALEERFPPRRRIFGAQIGLAAVLSSLLFAVGHLVGMAQAARLATFFPALVFAWLWRRSGNLWAPALFHMSANLLMELLLASTFRA